MSSREDQEVKNALANFLGFAMSKSKELDNSVTNGAGIKTKNIDAVITKAAQDIESRFENSNFVQPQPMPPMPEFEITTNIPDGGSPYLLAPPYPNETVIAQRAQAPTSNQLELDLDFTDPSPQTKLILSEIKHIESKLNAKLNAILECVQKKTPDRKTSSPSSKKTIKSKL